MSYKPEQVGKSRCNANRRGNYKWFVKRMTARYNRRKGKQLLDYASTKTQYAGYAD